MICYEKPRFDIARIDAAYHPGSLLSFYNTAFYPDNLPEVLAECPFEMRNEGNDEEILYGYGGAGIKRRRRASKSECGTPRPSPMNTPRKAPSSGIYSPGSLGSPRSPGSPLEELNTSEVLELFS